MIILIVDGELTGRETLAVLLLFDTAHYKSQGSQRA